MQFEHTNPSINTFLYTLCVNFMVGNVLNYVKCTTLKKFLNSKLKDYGRNTLSLQYKQFNYIKKKHFQINRLFSYGMYLPRIFKMIVH